jgi:diguanylate cyclase (GGDEF)-like protein
MLLSMPIVSGLRWGTATAVLSLESVEAQIRENRARILLLSFVMSALVGLLLSLVLRRAVLLPLRLLTGAATKISTGQLDARVEESTHGDEMALLGEVFNEMAEKVQWQTKALEGLVTERTQQLQQTNLELETVVEQLKQLARTDGLTGLRNHRAFQEALNFELERARRTQRPLSLLMLDVDHFKAYNDTHGHPGGDRVLRLVAQLLEKNLRTVDVVARYGGEEFVILLLETPGVDAQLVAEKLRLAVASVDFEGAERSQPGGRLTISLGLASFPLQATTGEALLALADAALYRAKHAGRNQVWRDNSRDT